MKGRKAPENKRLSPVEFPPGKLITLEIPQPKHLARMREILSDEISLRYLPHMLRPGGWTLAEVEERFATWAKNRAAGESFAHIMTETKTGAVVGYTGFYRYDGVKGEGGVALDKAYWAKGYGCDGHLALLSYAFDVSKFKAIEFVTMNTNVRTQKFYESLGLSRVKEALRLAPNGQFVDAVYYEVTDQTWPAMRDKLEAKISRALNG